MTVKRIPYSILYIWIYSYISFTDSEGFIFEG